MVVNLKAFNWIVECVCGLHSCIWFRWPGTFGMDVRRWPKSQRSEAQGKHVAIIGAEWTQGLDLLWGFCHRDISTWLFSLWSEENVRFCGKSEFHLISFKKYVYFYHMKQHNYRAVHILQITHFHNHWLRFYGKMQRNPGNTFGGWSHSTHKDPWISS